MYGFFFFRVSSPTNSTDCTAFKPKSSPRVNKYTHADIQVGLADALGSCPRGAEVSGVTN